MQCRMDILRSRNQSKENETAPTPAEPAEISGQASDETHVKRSDTVAARVKHIADESKVRIPDFEDLVSSENKVFDGIWETPVKNDPKSETQIRQNEEINAETAVQPAQEQTQSSSDAAEEKLDDPGLELDPDNIVTAEEEQALFGEPETEVSEIEEPQSKSETAEKGLDALRKIVAEAKNHDQPEINEVEDAVNMTIPKFDLAEQILKEQRQVASKRRQRPARSRNLNVMPIAGTVGQIIEQAKKAAQQKDSQPIAQPDLNPDETDETEPVDFDKMEVVKFQDDPGEPVLSVAACRIVNESNRLNPFQEDIIIDIVSRDIARFCGELTTNC